MRKLIASEFITLDGIMEEPGGGDKTEFGGWSFQFWNEEAEKYKYDELFSCDALLLGRVTYDGFAAAWPAMTDETGFADRMNSLPKYVVSTTLEEAQWNNSILIKENVIEEVKKLKQQSGQNIVIHGSGDLISTLMKHNLIDEYHLMVHPIIVGGGKRLFKKGMDQKSLKLIDTKSFKTGVVVLVYQPE